MPKTLLNTVNDVLKKVGFISSESGELTSLTDSARQVEIDLVKANANTIIDELYVLINKPNPREVGSSDITLVTDTREYDLPAGLLQIRYPLINQTTQNDIYEYPGGFEQMRKDQPTPSDHTGVPKFVVISPETGKLRFDRIPTASENGDVYDLIYDKDVALDVAGDQVPFNDAVYRHFVNVVAIDWSEDQRPGDTTTARLRQDRRRKSLSLAAKYLSNKQHNNNWGVKLA